jgi:hypothetical protein
MNVGLKGLRQPGESKATSAGCAKIPTLDKARMRRKRDGASEPVEVVDPDLLTA